MWVGCTILKPDNMPLSTTEENSMTWNRVVVKGSIPEIVLDSQSKGKKLTEIKGLVALHFPMDINHLPLWIARLQRLTEMKLKDRTMLKDLPVEMASLTLLRELDLDGCSRLDIIPEWIGRLTNLTRMSLKECFNLQHSLKSLPSSLQNLKLLTALDLDNYTELEEVPEWLGQLTSLTRLSLSGCRNLKSALSLFPSSMEDLKHLKSLNLDGCLELKELPEWLGTLASLNSISLVGCPKLENIRPQVLLTLSSLEYLDCSECKRLWSPPHEICEQGPVATMKFLRSVKKEGTFSKDMTLLFIGDGEAGKTSAINSLISDSNCSQHIRSDHRTIGIDISEWEPAGADLRLSIMDLAGQAVYSKTHRFFLLRRAVYVFVWRAGNFDFKQLREAIKYWLNSLQNQMPGSHVILVVTHIDLVDKNTLESQCTLVKEVVSQWKATKTTLSGGEQDDDVLRVYEEGQSFRVNCLNGSGIPELRVKLLDYIKSMPWFLEALPSSWIKLRVRLDICRQSQNYLEWAKYEELAIDCGIEDDDMRMSATRFLHDSGVIRHFGRKDVHLSATAQSTVYISPGWMINIMKGLLRHDTQALTDFFVQQQNKIMIRRVNRLNICGRLHQSLLPFLWPEMPESKDFWRFVRAKGARERNLWKDVMVSSKIECSRAVGLLEGFNLFVEEGNEYIVPSVLAPTALPCIPKLDIKECPFRVKLSYAALPPGAFEAIINQIAKIGGLSVDFTACLATFRKVPSTSSKSHEIAQLFFFKDSNEISDHQASKRNSQNYDCVHLVLRSSDKDLFLKAADCVKAIETSFAGLIRQKVQQSKMKMGFPKRTQLYWEGDGKSVLISSIRCSSCGKKSFSRRECLYRWTKWLESKAQPDSTNCSECGNQSKLFDLLTNFQIPEIRSCPACHQSSKQIDGVGSFNASECRLKLMEADQGNATTVTCYHCLASGRLGQIRVVDIVPAEMFASGIAHLYGEMQKRVNSLLEKVELNAEVICYNRFNQKSGKEDVMFVLVFLSDAYVVSEPCQQEFLEAAYSCKHLVPILMPNTTRVNDQGVSLGWSGPTDTRLWVHATELSRQKYQDFHAQGIECSYLKRRIPWFLLDNFDLLKFPDENHGTTHLESRPIEIFKPLADQSDFQRPLRDETDLLSLNICEIIKRHLQRPGKVEVYSDFSKLGVLVSYFEVFLQECGGRESVKGLSTKQIMDRFVFPQTSASKLSFCEHLSQDPKGRRYVATAEWFYSHSWNFMFLDVVDAAAKHFKKKHTNPAIWFDVFSVSQHKAESRPFAWWNTIFFNSIGDMGNVLMLMQPFECKHELDGSTVPAWTTLTRVWCVFELYACESTNGVLEITMTEHMYARMMESFEEDSSLLLKTLTEIDCERSTASRIEDQARVFEVIHRTIGFPLLNSMVIGIIERWLYSELKDYMKAKSQDIKDGILKSMIHFCKTFLERRIVTPGIGKEHVDTLSSMNTLAGLYIQQGKLDEAEKLVSELWYLQKKSLGPYHPDTKAMMQTLSGLYINQGKFALALELNWESWASHKHASAFNPQDVFPYFREFSELKQAMQWM